MGLMVGAVVAGLAGQSGGEDAFVKKRKRLAHKKRRIILNNDGCDCLYFPKGLDPTPENFLKQRTSPLEDSQVDAVFYCTISSGFSNFTHKTEKGHILTRQVGEELHVEGKTNITQDLIDQGADVLEIVVKWCHEHDRECFWSFRMNDTHDGAHRPDKPYPLFPKLKEEHPEFMIGELGKRPKHGSWTSVNYALPVIRDLAVQYIEEVCRNYDVDGIEMDFCRHLSYFPCVAFGVEATDDERELMTAMLKRVREVCETHGKKRGRPILIAVRVPDSLEYSRAVGLDLERWMKEDFVDLVTGGFYMRLNPWEYLVDAGKKYDVPIYAGLSESRVRGDIPPFGRNSQESYRGRANRAWQAGVDGIYLFNYFHPEGGFLREIGELETLRPLDKVYYATVRNRNPNSYLHEGDRFLNLPMVTPQNPLGIPVGETREVDLYVGEEGQRGQAGEGSREQTAEMTLCLHATGEEGLRVAWNRTPLKEPSKEEGWLVYALDPSSVLPGKNRVELRADPVETPESHDPEWKVIYEGTDMPRPPWICDSLKQDLICEVKDGALLIADRGEKNGDYIYCGYPWNTDPDEQSVVEVSVQVLSGWNNVIVSNGLAYERVSLYPDRVAFYEAKTEYAMDTTDQFHTYRIVLKKKDILVYVDGELVLDGTGKFTKPLPGRNDVRFGAANSPNLGEAYWQSVKLRFKTGQATVRDLLLRVE